MLRAAGQSGWVGLMDFILLMHGDAGQSVTPDLWPPYLAKLRELGAFAGGSAIGGGMVLRKDGASRPVSAQLSGYIRIQAVDMAAAAALVAGNPVLECGGSVEIRELPPE